MAAKGVKTQFVCADCGNVFASWYGKCPSCHEWNTLKEVKIQKGGGSAVIGRPTQDNAVFTPLDKVDAQSTQRIPTIFDECNRVLGGGIVPGEVILIAGEPGVGKSTLLLKVFSSMNVVYVSGEESGDQVKQRAERMSVSLDSITFTGTNHIDAILDGLDTLSQKPQVVIVDSIQTVYTTRHESSFGSPTQIREVTAAIVEYAKRTGICFVIVGHVTKDGDIAGPKTLEHFVDCVLYLEGERYSQLRLLRAHKNRYGSTDEVGLFEMNELGLSEASMSQFTDEYSHVGSPGKAKAAVVEGSRVFLYEIQSLVVPTSLAMPRRVVAGIDNNRLQLILAVLRKYLSVAMDNYDIYVSVVGGLSAKLPATDLAIAMSVLSSLQSKIIPSDVAFAGEIGLLGEIRKVVGHEKLKKNVSRLNVKSIYTYDTITHVKQCQKVLK